MIFFSRWFSSCVSCFSFFFFFGLKIWLVLFLRFMVFFFFNRFSDHWNRLILFLKKNILIKKFYSLIMYSLIICKQFWLVKLFSFLKIDQLKRVGVYNYNANRILWFYKVPGDFVGFLRNTNSLSIGQFSR